MFIRLIVRPVNGKLTVEHCPLPGPVPADAVEWDTFEATRLYCATVEALTKEFERTTRWVPSTEPQAFNVCVHQSMKDVDTGELIAGLLQAINGRVPVG